MCCNRELDFSLNFFLHILVFISSLLLHLPVTASPFQYRRRTSSSVVAFVVEPSLVSPFSLLFKVWGSTFDCLLKFRWLSCNISDLLVLQELLIAVASANFHSNFREDFDDFNFIHKMFFFNVNW